MNNPEDDGLCYEASARDAALEAKKAIPEMRREIEEIRAELRLIRKEFNRELDEG
jgi:hypothetical protein